MSPGVYVATHCASLAKLACFPPIATRTRNDGRYESNDLPLFRAPGMWNSDHREAVLIIRHLNSLLPDLRCPWATWVGPGLVSEPCSLPQAGIFKMNTCLLYEYIASTVLATALLRDCSF